VVNFIVIRIIPFTAAIMFTEACRYTCNQLFTLRSSWPLHTGVRDVIRTLGCARQSRRGCRAGKRARDRRPSNVNNNIALSSADRSMFAIPTVSTRRYGSGYGSFIGSFIGGPDSCIMDVMKAASPYDVPFNSIRNLFLAHQRPSV